MDETIREIENHIDRTRDRLGSNLKELEQKVDAATDWRGQFRARPYPFLTAAFVGGAVAAAVLRPTRNGRPNGGHRSDARRAVSRTGVEARLQALELWETVQTALVGLLAARVMGYIGELMPGFDEHVRRAEQRRSAGFHLTPTDHFERPGDVESERFQGHH